MGGDVDIVAQAAIDALDALSEYKDEPNGLYHALINAFRLSGQTTTPIDAVMAVIVDGIGFDKDGNPSITQNVFDGRKSQLLVRDDDGKNVTVQKWFSNHPNSNAIEYGGSVYLGGGFFNLDQQGRAQAIIHEFVVHIAFGRKDIEFGKTRHEGSDSINNTIRRSYRQPPVPRY